MEIGGYFELENLINNEYYKNMINLNTARNALLYILKVKNIKKIYIPFYLCDSIENSLILNNYEFEKYHIAENFMPKINFSLKSDEYLFIVNYFGQLTENNIIELKNKFVNIIIDNTQAFFHKPIENIDTIYSCRKFFGVPDGAYLYTVSKYNVDLEIDFSKERMRHILGRYEGKASDYYNDFLKIENNLSKEPIKYMSKLTHNILCAIDYKKVKSQRESNFNILCELLNKYNMLNIGKQDGPFMYPLLIKNGDIIRKSLINKKIYIPILWQSVINYNSTNSIEYNYSNNILPLPCDQRLNIDDMKYIIKIIKDILENFDEVLI